MTQTERKQRKDRTALECAFAILAGRPLSEAELAKKLQQKGYDECDVSSALLRCKEYGYVNDAELVKRYAAALARERKLGPFVLARKLALRGFSGDLVERAMAELEVSADVPSEIERARLLADKKFRGGQASPENREKLIRFLRSKGFEWDIIRQVFEGRVD